MQTKAAAQQARDINGPVALVVKKNTFDKYAAPKVEADLPMGREEAIIAAAETLEDNAAVICTTGMPSRELFEFRARNEAGHHRDFLTVGGMGTRAKSLLVWQWLNLHARSIALTVTVPPNAYGVNGDHRSI